MYIQQPHARNLRVLHQRSSVLFKELYAEFHENGKPGCAFNRVYSGAIVLNKASTCIQQ